MPSHSIEDLSDGGLSDAQIKHMVSRFLGWRLPDPFRPDNGITFTPTAHQRGEYGPAHWPVGTNLLDATQAEAMVRHMIEGLPEAAELDAVGAAERDVGRWVYRRIEALMDAKPDTPEAAELAWLAEVVESIEEYGPEACSDTALAAFPALSAAPSDGWVLVPREPTEAMLNASWHAIRTALAEDRMAMELTTSRRAHDIKAAVRYRAMLSAAPERVDEIYRAGMDAELPARFQWGADAMEQFRFGKRRAVEEILRLIQGSASPPIGAEGGKPTSAGVSRCREGTQEPSPSGAQSDDGKGVA